MKKHLIIFLSCWVLATASLGLGAANKNHIGEVILSSGVATSQSGSQPARILAKGEHLYKGDKITISKSSFAVIKLADGSRITLRPGTVLVIDDINIEKGSENALLSLLKGGIRAVTGFISKNRPNHFNVNTQSAALGIRGTEFDARLCEKDCAKESSAQQGKTKAITSPVMARVHSMNGLVKIVGVDKQVRLATKGAPVYSRDRVMTDSNSYALLAFRDETRVMVKKDTVFDVEKYYFDSKRHLKQQSEKTQTKRQATPQQGDVASFGLVEGIISIFTGYIAKKNPAALKLKTSATTIGIRGTGFDVYASKGCKSALTCDLYAHVWSGEIYLQLPSGQFFVKKGETVFLEREKDKPVKLPKTPIFFQNQLQPRLDAIDIDFDNLFGTVAGDNTRPGLYVSVRDGHIAVSKGDKVIDLGRSENAFAGEVDVERLDTFPDFIKNDIYPKPDELDDNVLRIIELIHGDAANQECRL